MEKRNFWKGKKILVTGGSGFIGGFLAEAALKNGAMVAITDLAGKKPAFLSAHSGLKVLRGDLLDAKFADKAAKGIDMIFHFAALKKNAIFYKKYPVETFEANLELSKNILKAAQKNKIKKTILISTSLVSGVKKNAPSGSYIVAKKAMESLAEFYSAQYGMDITVIRMNNIFGPRDNFDVATAQVIPSLIRRIKNRENPLMLFSAGTEKRRFLYIEDVAGILLKIAKKESKNFEIFEMNADKEFSIKEIIKVIMEIEGIKIPVKFTSAKKNKENPAAPKIIKIPTKLKPSLKKTIDWYESSLEK